MENFMQFITKSVINVLLSPWVRRNFAEKHVYISVLYIFVNMLYM